jgi:hypothetical protein
MNSGTAEFYLIAGYMALTLLIGIVAVYFFFRQYKREMTAKAEAKKKKAEESASEKQ